MQRRQRIRQIRARQLRRRKNVSFKQLSLAEIKAVDRQGLEAIEKRWDGEFSCDDRRMEEIEKDFGEKFAPLLGELSKRFPGPVIRVLDEGAGRSQLKGQLKKINAGKKIRVTRTDVREGFFWPDKVVNVIGLVKGDGKFRGFGKNRFHMVVSSAGGPAYSPVPEKALFQLVSVLKPGGIGLVNHAGISKKRIYELAKRFNITIRKKKPRIIVFTKNYGRRKWK